MDERLTMSSAETNHVTTPAAPTATIEEEDFQYFDEVASVCASEERLPMTGNMTAGLEVPTLVRVATCGSTISHIKQDPRSVIHITLTATVCTESFLFC